MSRIFADGSSAYFDTTSGKFVSVKPGEVATGAKGFKPPVAAPAYEPFNYDSIVAMEQKADMTLAGQMRDCGECHVGGGGMEYQPRNEGWDDTAAGGRVPHRTTAQVATDYTAINYFIDVFDEDGDGELNEVLFNDFAKTGVIEMDCLSCHLEGYDWAKAKDAKRQGRFDASRAYAAGIADIYEYTNVDGDIVASPLVPFTAADANVMPAGYGTHVAYDEAKLTLQDTCSDYDAARDPSHEKYCVQGLTDGYYVNISTTLKTIPPTENCAACHQGKYQVDWKKRGEMSPDADIHARLGCMGCHERKDDINTGFPLYPSANVGTSLNIRDGKLGHDPAKGGAGQWDNLNNKNDWKEFKTCNDCHSSNGDLGTRGKNFGAPNAAAAHAAYGLTATIVQTGKDGVANANHLDLISCEACHITKSQPVPHTMIDKDGVEHSLNYASGGAFVDGTAPDHEGRLATHDTYEVTRDMYNPATGINFGYTWANDKKIHAGNWNTSLFWRDKNDINYDANVDGRPHGMDAILQTHVLENALLELVGEEHEGHPFYYGLLADGVSDDVEVGEAIAALNTNLPTLNGKVPNGTTIGDPKVRLSWLTVPFTMSHDIDMAANAWGAGGCTDCHGDSPAYGGFYKGTIDMSGNSEFAFDAAQTTAMTKVNGMSEMTFSHPNVKDKFRVMSVPLMTNNGPAIGDSDASIRDVDRSELLYPAVFQTIDTSYKSEPIVGASAATGGLFTKRATWKGWYLNIEYTDGVTDTGDASIWVGPSNAATGTPFAHPDGVNDTAAELLGMFPAAFTDSSFTYHFNVSTGVDNNFIITPESGYSIRIASNSFYGPFGLKNQIVVADPIVPTIKGLAGWNTVNNTVEEIDGNTEMVAYLDAVADYITGGDGVVDAGDLEGTLGVGETPTATISTLNGLDPALGVTVTGAATVSAAADASAAGSTYEWRVYSGNDDLVTYSGQTPAIDIPRPGTYTVELSVVSVDGVRAADMTHIVAYDEVRGTGAMSFTAGVTPVGGVLTLTDPAANIDPPTALTADFNLVRVDWGDGVVENYTLGGALMAGVSVDGGFAYNGADVEVTRDTNYDGSGYTVTVKFINTAESTSFAIDTWTMFNVDATDGAVTSN